MPPLAWSRHTLYASLVGWGVLLTVYLALGAVNHPVPPSPYNGMIMMVLSVITGVSAAACLNIWLHERNQERHTHAEAAREADREWLAGQIVDIQVAADVRYARLHSQLFGIARRIEALDGPTQDFPRPPQLVAVGGVPATDETKLPGYARGYADGLARRPMDGDAQVIPLERR